MREGITVVGNYRVRGNTPPRRSRVQCQTLAIIALKTIKSISHDGFTTLVLNTSTSVVSSCALTFIDHSYSVHMSTRAAWSGAGITALREPTRVSTNGALRCPVLLHDSTSLILRKVCRQNFWKRAFADLGQEGAIRLRCRTACSEA